MATINPVGLGTFPFSHVFGKITDKEANHIVHKYLDLGGMYIQTAPYYEGVDDLMSNLLRGVPRDKYYLSTLCVKNREGKRTGKYASIMEQCSDSLSHLKIDYIDLYMPSTTKADDATFEETAMALHDLQTQGKIREIGVCNVSLDQLKVYNSSGHIKYVQNRLSLLDRSIDQEFQTYCSKDGIKIIPYNVIEWGVLTNKILKGISLEKEDLRNTLREFENNKLDVLKSWSYNYLKPIAEERRISIAQLAIGWALNQPNIITCAVGATTVDQLLENMQSSNLLGDTGLVEKVNEAYDILKSIVEKDCKQSLEDFLGNAYGYKPLNRK